jgi:phosphatidylglycerophosphatase A
MLADENSYEPENSMGSRLAVWLATGLGLGLVAPAPGTFAGLWGLGLAAAVSLLSPIGAQLGIILLVAIVAAAICGSAARALGPQHDPGAIVLDEIVALPIVFIGVPAMSWSVLLAGYLLFRLCDIWKPGLARSAEQLPGGLGIVADDCLAAVLACILLHGVMWLDRSTGLAWLTSAA